MGDNTSNIISNSLKWILPAIAILYVCIYIVIVCLRIRYPFELEWLEGSIVDHVARVMSGQKIYVRPSLEFVPYLYTPLYYYVSAALATITGAGFFPLRMVSFFASLGSFVLIFLFVKRETKETLSAILAAGMFAATFEIGGAWLDLARVDSLFVLFLLAGFYVIKPAESVGAYALAGLLFSLSFLTKQTALAASAPVILYCFLRNPRRGVFGIATFIAIVGLSTLIMDRFSEGWYTYYVFRMPAGHSLEKAMLLKFWTLDILKPLAIAVFLSIFYLYSLFSNSKRQDFLFFLCMAVGAFGSSWMSRLHEGGYANVVLPAYAATSILFGLAAHTVIEYAHNVKTGRKEFAKTCIYALCILQFGWQYYNPAALIPTQRDLEAGKRFIAFLENIEGDVLIPYHSHLAVLAGKKSFAHVDPMKNVLKGSRGQAQTRFVIESRESVKNGNFGGIILSAVSFDTTTGDRNVWGYGLLFPNIEGYCIEKRPLIKEDTALWPVTGLKIRPEFLMNPCPEGEDKP